MDVRVDRTVPPIEVDATNPCTAKPWHRGWLTFSPLNQRRWRTFKSNRRGYYSFLTLHGVVLHHLVRRIRRE